MNSEAKGQRPRSQLRGPDCQDLSPRCGQCQSAEASERPSDLTVHRASAVKIVLEPPTQLSGDADAL